MVCRQHAHSCFPSLVTTDARPVMRGSVPASSRARMLSWGLSSEAPAKIDIALQQERTNRARRGLTRKYTPLLTAGQHAPVGEGTTELFGQRLVAVSAAFLGTNSLTYAPCTSDRAMHHGWSVIHGPA
jgi:hypothetical protein